MVSFLNTNQDVNAAELIAVKNNNPNAKKICKGGTDRFAGGITLSIVKISINILAEKIPINNPSNEPNKIMVTASVVNNENNCLGDIPIVFSSSISISFYTTCIIIINQIAATVTIIEEIKEVFSDPYSIMFLKLPSKDPMRSSTFSTVLPNSVSIDSATS